MLFKIIEALLEAFTRVVVLLAPRLGSMRLPQSLFSESGYGFLFYFGSNWYKAGQAHELLASIASLSVALQQLVLSIRHKDNNVWIYDRGSFYILCCV